MVAQFYQRRAAWDSVRRRTETLLQKHPMSKHAKEALGLKAMAHHHLKQKENFDKVMTELRSKYSDEAKRIEKKIEESAKK